MSNIRTEKREGRPYCEACERPAKVCICDVLPKAGELSVQTRILILQHPHELRQKFSTVSLLQKCIPDSLHVIRGRKLQETSYQTIHNLIPDPEETLLLFPSKESKNLQDYQSQRQKLPGKNALLVVIDGTWEHSKEMVKASMDFLKTLEGFRQVCLPHNPNLPGPWIGNSDLILRKEPFGGCVSTLEAVARSLEILEPESSGSVVKDRLLSVLRRVVEFQSMYLRQPLNPRPKLVKKAKKGLQEQGFLEAEAPQQ